MGKALYRKYRSRGLGEIVGQEHITSTLSSALKSDKISHAYLLTGPKGVGKTSIARILAHEINQLPYSEDTNLDIIEIDAASNRRIDEIRDLREHIHAAPASAKYKVFIIDEVHMLTKEAFNALLKTLEEPPEHVVFILATTETHKLPETIISRTQRFSFRPVALDQVVDHLSQIAKKENIDIDNEALVLVAEHGEGSFRDSISLLDQASASGEKITKESVENILGRAPSKEILVLVKDIAEGKPSEVLQRLNSMFNNGFDAAVLATQLSSRLRSDLLKEDGLLDRSVSLPLLKDLLSVPGALNAKQLLEITLLSHTIPDVSQPAKQPSQAKTPNNEIKLTEAEKPSQAKYKPNEAKPEDNNLQDISPEAVKNDEVAKPKNISPEEPIEEPPENVQSLDEANESTTEPESALSDSPAPSVDAKELWEDVLDKIKRTHNTLYGMARMAKPRLENDTLYLSLKFAFHYKQLNTAKNTTVLVNAASEERGRPTKLKFELVDNKDKGNKTEDISAISNIFGGAELL